MKEIIKKNKECYTLVFFSLIHIGLHSPSRLKIYGGWWKLIEYISNIHKIQDF